MSDTPMTLDGEYIALFASMWQRVPTFHTFGRDKRRSEDGVSADFTRCGLLVSSYNYETHKLVEKLTWVPMRHALTFGKPCRRCFPAEVQR